MKEKYIYNIKQADFFVKRGAKCIGVDVHRDTKKVFIVFQDGDIFQDIYDMWIADCRSRKISQE